MPRKPRPGGLDELAGAALAVFARSGFRQAQMVDVAREMGAALGTIYSYVESKEALFGLVVDRFLLGGADTEVALPVPTPDAEDLLGRTERRLADLMALPILHDALGRRRSRDPRHELASVLEELWELISRTRLAADMVERSARDWPELSLLFYEKARRNLFDRLSEYVGMRSQSGQFRTFANPGLIARTALETITFWARHRYGDPDGFAVTDADARQTVLAFLVDSIVKGDPK
ncbi:MAG: TetR/AcrR family transcriptional regulator [Acidimicrobiales bacterium]